MTLLALGINHKTAAVEVREQVAFTPAQLEAALTELGALKEVHEAALLSTCNMPKGIPVGTMSLGSHGAVNAALFATAILATADPQIETRLIAFRQKQTESVPETGDW